MNSSFITSRLGHTFLPNYIQVGIQTKTFVISIMFIKLFQILDMILSKLIQFFNKIKLFVVLLT